jgi:hypothetical protein
MPRLTRAQLRAQEAEGGPQIIHEDLEVASASTPQDYDPFSTELSSRPPLGEIHANNTPAPEPQQTQPDPLAKEMKALKKGKAGGKNKFDLTLANSENVLPNVQNEVLEDESQSDASSAAEAAAEDLRRDKAVPETFQVPRDTTRPRTPPSIAAREASRSLSRSPEKMSIAVHGSAPKTPKFDPIVHVKMPFAEQTKEEDSFVKSFRKTPARIAASPEFVGDGSDSFVEDIIRRSPSKYVARIEDSVEAMDALEEAIEQVSEELPKAIADGLESPVKTRTLRIATPKTSPEQTALRAAASIRKTTKSSVSVTKSSLATKTSAPNKLVARKPLPRVSSARPQPRPSTSTHLLSQAKAPRPSTTATSAAPPSTTTTDTKRAPSTTARNLSTSRPGFVPSKSAKPPTKSTFTLPGDAISAKLKAQREERQKKEEAEAEAAKKRTEFKARPVPKAIAAAVTRNGSGRVSSVAVPRETAASRARMSLMAAKKEVEGSNKEDVGAGTRKLGHGTESRSVTAAISAPRKSVMPPTAQSGMAVTKTRTRSSVPAGAAPTGRLNKTAVPANSSALRRNTTTYPTAPPKTRKSIIQPATTATSRTPRTGSDGSASTTKPTTTTTTGTGTVKGKEVFIRGKMAEEELLKQKREKEEAARRARAEASERGRKASREWAEKQRKKKAEAGMRRVVGENRKAEVKMENEDMGESRELVVAVGVESGSVEMDV